MEKYIVKFDRYHFDTCYYEVEAESEEDAISDFMGKVGDGRAKFLFDEVGDLPDGNPEIERRNIKLLKQLKKRYKELYYKDRGEIAVDGAFWHHDDNEAKVDYRKLLPEEHDDYEHEMKMLAFEMLDVQNAIARQKEIDRYDSLLSWKAKEYARKQENKKRIDELSEEHA